MPISLMVTAAPSNTQTPDTLEGERHVLEKIRSIFLHLGLSVSSDTLSSMWGSKAVRGFR